MTIRTKQNKQPNIDTTDTDGLNRYLAASEGLTAALQRNVDLVIEPDLKRRLQQALERIQERGGCRLGQRSKKRR